MARRAETTWKRNGRTVLGIKTAMESMVVNTEMDIAVEHTMEVDMAVNTVEAMVMMVMLSTFTDRRCLHGQYYHRNTNILTAAGMLFLCLKMRPTL
jgi:hypothetical protein